MQLLRSVLFGLAAVVAVDARNCPVGDTSIVAHTGQSVGHIENHNGGKYTKSQRRRRTNGLQWTCTSPHLLIVMLALTTRRL